MKDKSNILCYKMPTGENTPKLSIIEEQDIEKVKKVCDDWANMADTLEDEDEFDFDKFKYLLVETVPLLQKYVSDTSVPRQIVSLLLKIEKFSVTAYYNPLNDEVYAAKKIVGFLFDQEFITTDEKTKKTYLFVFGDTRPHNICIEENIDLSDLLTDIL